MLSDSEAKAAAESFDKVAQEFLKFAGVTGVADDRPGCDSDGSSGRSWQLIEHSSRVVMILMQRQQLLLTMPVAFDN